MSSMAINNLNDWAQILHQSPTQNHFYINLDKSVRVVVQDAKEAKITVADETFEKISLKKTILISRNLLKSLEPLTRKAKSELLSALGTLQSKTEKSYNVWKVFISALKNLFSGLGFTSNKAWLKRLSSEIEKMGEPLVEKSDFFNKLNQKIAAEKPKAVTSFPSFQSRVEKLCNDWQVSNFDELTNCYTAKLENEWDGFLNGQQTIEEHVDTVDRALLVEFKALAKYQEIIGIIETACASAETTPLELNTEEDFEAFMEGSRYSLGQTPEKKFQMHEILIINTLRHDAIVEFQKDKDTFTQTRAFKNFAEKFNQHQQLKNFYRDHSAGE